MHQSSHVLLLAEYTYFYKDYHVFYVNKETALLSCKMAVRENQRNKLASDCFVPFRLLAR